MKYQTKVINTKKLISSTFLIAIFLFSFGRCSRSIPGGPIKVLILSGRNNHEWQKTTPLLERIYNESGLFSVSVTELPDTLTYKSLTKYDVVISNWNTWPDNVLRFTDRWEKDFTKYVKNGGGTVFIHAGASSFYSWDNYHKIGIGRWGKETKHGEQTKGKITGFNQENPITRGFRDFYIMDEIWEKTDIHPAAQAIATVAATDLNDGHIINENAVFVNQTGKGRSFFTILGHNERALLNKGLQSLLLRATQWASRREVTFPLPNEFTEKSDSENNDFSWEQSDTTLSLLRNHTIVWRYNFRNRFGKPYFHPLTVNNSTLTCVSPPDHPWHLGLWFSWKYINGINYWEYLDNFKSEETGYKSEGITQLLGNEIKINTDFSANIAMEFLYRPAEEDPVMQEKRNVYVSPPSGDGSYFIDYDFLFSALKDDIVLDRTPLQNEPGGKTWGGYAGLSVRFSQDYTSPMIIAPDDTTGYKKNRWVYMGFNTLTGKTAGICIFQNMKYTTNSTSWYLINNPEIPFFYYSPAVLFDGRIVLKKGESIHLKYRVWMIPGKTSIKQLQTKYDEYIKN